VSLRWRPGVIARSPSSICGLLAGIVVFISGCGGGGSSPSTASSPTPTVTPTPGLTPTPSPTPTVLITPSPSPTAVPAGVISAPQMIAIGDGNSTATTIPVAELGYTGMFTATSTCAGIASVQKTSGPGSLASFTVVQVAAGVCAVTITDNRGGSVVVSVVSTTNAIQLQSKGSRS